MGQLHATTVAIDGKGVLIMGPSGAGKSSLALELMAVGAMLVADDRTDILACDGGLIASVPQALSGRIEARGLGILHAPAHGPVPLALAVDLGQAEAQRLPPARSFEYEGISLPLVLGPYRPHLYAALRQLLLAGRAQ